MTDTAPVPSACNAGAVDVAVFSRSWPQAILHSDSVQSRMSDGVSRLSDVVCRASSIGYRLSGVVCRASSVGCRLSNVVRPVSSIACRVSCCIPIDCHGCILLTDLPDIPLSSPSTYVPSTTITANSRWCPKLHAARVRPVLRAQKKRPGWLVTLQRRSLNTCSTAFVALDRAARSGSPGQAASSGYHSTLASAAARLCRCRCYYRCHGWCRGHAWSVSGRKRPGVVAGRNWSRRLLSVGTC